MKTIKGSHLSGRPLPLQETPQISDELCIAALTMDRTLKRGYTPDGRLCASYEQYCLPEDLQWGSRQLHQAGHTLKRAEELLEDGLRQLQVRELIAQTNTSLGPLWQVRIDNNRNNGRRIGELTGQYSEPKLIRAKPGEIHYTLQQPRSQERVHLTWKAGIPLYRTGGIGAQLLIRHWRDTQFRGWPNSWILSPIGPLETEQIGIAGNWPGLGMAIAGQNHTTATAKMIHASGTLVLLSKDHPNWSAIQCNQCIITTRPPSQAESSQIRGDVLEFNATANLERNHWRDIARSGVIVASLPSHQGALQRVCSEVRILRRYTLKQGEQRIEISMKGIL